MVVQRITKSANYDIHIMFIFVMDKMFLRQTSPNSESFIFFFQIRKDLDHQLTRMIC